MTRNKDAETVWRMDRDHFIHPYTDFSTFKKEGSKVISEANGNHVTDSEGKQYLDGIAGLWCANVGHGRRDMADAIHEQILKMEYSNPFGHYSNEPASILAGELADLTPGKLNHVFFTNGGSVSNDTAIRLVHYYNNLRGKPNKKKIISRVNGYHGATCVAAQLTGIAGTKNSFDQFGQDLIHHVSAADMYRRPCGAEDLSEEAYTEFLANEFENRIMQLGPDNVAAFIAEPIMGAGGVLVAPKGYHKRMHQICKQYDVLFIADEVVTAFGRLGEWFTSESLFDYTPDIMIVAKGINSGYVPLGACILSSEIYDVISVPQCKGGTLSMGFTYSGHAVACAAALKNFEILREEQLLENVRKLGPYLMSEASRYLDIPIVGDVRGSHFMMGVELVADKDTKAEFDVDVGSAMRVAQKCQEKGLIVRPIGNILVISPPLTFERRDVDELVTTLGEGLKEVADELG